MNIEEKHNRLIQILKKLGKVVIAYSGGTDSSFLLKSAVDTLGPENVLACIAAGPLLPQRQYTEAVNMAKEIGVELKTVRTNEMTDAKFLANKADRCFHCKSHLIGKLSEIAKQKGFDKLICGGNLDDESDFRPGNRALKIFRVNCPLAEARLTKENIRQLSRQLNLPTADMPASPCLGSRISYGLEITEQRLKQIEQAENFLRQYGLTEFRVRHHDTIARIEVKPADTEKITSEPVRSKIIEKLKSLGFTYITIDLQGFRSGALNEALSESEKQRSI